MFSNHLLGNSKQLIGTDTKYYGDRLLNKKIKSLATLGIASQLVSIIKIQIREKSKKTRWRLMVMGDREANEYNSLNLSGILFQPIHQKFISECMT